MVLSYFMQLIINALIIKKNLDKYLSLSSVNVIFVIYIHIYLSNEFIQLIHKQRDYS